MSHIEQTYKRKWDAVLENCLGRVGEYGLSNQYSVTGYIESDHTLPFNVWERTTNFTMTRVAKMNRGKFRMPAITIPYSVHRPLLTTGPYDTVKARHRDRLVQLCDNGEADQALILCLHDYKNNQLPMHAYRTELRDLVDEYESLGVISARQKRSVLQELGQLCR